MQWCNGSVDASENTCIKIVGGHEISQPKISEPNPRQKVDV